MEQEISTISGQVENVMTDEGHTVSLADLLLACTGAYTAINEQTFQVEKELAQYGYKAPRK